MLLVGFGGKNFTKNAIFPKLSKALGQNAIFPKLSKALAQKAISQASQSFENCMNPVRCEKPWNRVKLEW